MSENQDTKKQLEADVLDLLNQIMVKMAEIPDPQVDDEYESDYGFSNIPTSFVENNDLKLASVKAVVTALVSDLNGSRKWGSEAEKMARAYYSSFCNA